MNVPVINSEHDVTNNTASYRFKGTCSLLKIPVSLEFDKILLWNFQKQLRGILILKTELSFVCPVYS